MEVAMRTILALVLSLGLVVPAHAIVIDSGSVGGGRVTDFSPFFNNMQGEGFLVTGIDIIGGTPFPSQVTGVNSLGIPIDLSHTATISSRMGREPFALTVQHDGQTFATGALTGALTFDVDPFVAQVVTSSSGGPPFAQGEGPFAMAGSLSFAGETVQVEGIGTAHYAGDLFGNAIGTSSIRFDFSPVPEPTTLTLVGTLGGLGALPAGGSAGRRVNMKASRRSRLTLFPDAGVATGPTEVLAGCMR
jgi:hypothetical protein